MPEGESTPGGVHVCESYNGKDICGEETMKIGRKISRCTGSEESVKECETTNET